MPTIGSLVTLAAGKAKRAEVNSNFSTIRTAVNTYGAWVDQTATISGAWTFSTAPVFTNAQTFAAAVTITTGGLTVTAGGLTVTAGASTFGANVTVTGTVAATTFSGSGASLTNLPAANITGTLPALDGSALTALNATNIASGTINNARLPSTISVSALVAGSANLGAVTSTSLTTDLITFDGGLLSMDNTATHFISSATAFGDLDFIAPGALPESTEGYLKCQFNSVDYYIPVIQFSV